MTTECMMTSVCSGKNEPDRTGRLHSRKQRISIISTNTESSRVRSAFTCMRLNTRFVVVSYVKWYYNKQELGIRGN